MRALTRRFEAMNELECNYRRENLSSDLIHSFCRGKGIFEKGHSKKLHQITTGSKSVSHFADVSGFTHGTLHSRLSSVLPLWRRFIWLILVFIFCPVLLLAQSTAIGDSSAEVRASNQSLLSMIGGRSLRSAVI